MGQKRNLAEKLSTVEVALVPTDTLLCALRMMERCRSGLLPVIGEAGRLVGLITRAHILSAWEVNPLLPISLVMAACEPRGGLSPLPTR